MNYIAKLGKRFAVYRVQLRELFDLRKRVDCLVFRTMWLSHSGIYRLIVEDVPVNGFWSVSVCNAAGYFGKNQLEAYTLNNLSAKKNADGSIVFQFGGCDDKIAKCLPITKRWNQTVRLYRLKSEILNGKWTLPGPQPV